MSDAVMALFGVPKVHDEDVPVRAREFSGLPMIICRLFLSIAL